MENSIELLTALQKELGYSEGDLSAVALLGLVGEAGEVLNETTYASDSPYSEFIVNSAINSCEHLDELKKSIRSGLVKAELYLPEDNEVKYVKELADTLYYLNILAMNQGLTLFDLAQVSHDKVRAKMQTPGGSSEQFQAPVPVVDIIEPKVEPDLTLLHWSVCGQPFCDINIEFPNHKFLMVDNTSKITCPVCKELKADLPF